MTAMDQLSAHLDRGWDLAQRGDAMGARASAERALALKPDAPEIHNLLGFAHALAGDCDDAIEAYQHAAMLDDTYVEAMLNAAELFLHPIGDADAALRMCRQALAVTTVPQEVLEVRLLSLEALLLKGEREEAARLLDKVTQQPLENPMHSFLAARACLELGEQARAGVLLEASLKGDPLNAEAHYHQGLWFERAGDQRQACGAFLSTRQLDLEGGLPGWAPDPESFLMFAQRALGQLDEKLQKFADHSEIYISDVPGCEIVVDGVDPRVLAMVDAGYAQPNAADSEANPEQPPLTVRIFLYALNVLRVASGIHTVQQCIAEALNEELSAALLDIETTSPSSEMPVEP